jgi:hypothetical protein
MQAGAKAVALFPAQTVLVVQTTEYMQYGSSGEAVVTFTVWRMREVNQSPQEGPETAAKKL